MKVGIDSYSFHRYFGDVYPGLQEQPEVRWDMKDDFIPFAASLGVDEVALETIFFPVMDDAYCAAVSDRLDEAGLERVIGWGHPDGLHGGRDEAALADLVAHVPRAARVGASIMRVVASSMLYVDEEHGPMVERSTRMLREAVRAAEQHDVVLALENHIDFTSSELLEIIEGVGSEHLRVNFDTGNALRLYEDPVEAARRLAPYCVATHTKDITVRRSGGSPASRFEWWPSCPVGEGLIDIAGVARELDAVGFPGSLAVEMDLVAAPWVDRPEEDNVRDSIAVLKEVVAGLPGGSQPGAAGGTR